MSSPEERPEDRERRRRRLQEVFGDALPEQTSDDTDTDSGEGRDDDWWRRQVPPHHG